MNLDDLDDKSVQEKIKNFHSSVEKIDKILGLALNSNIHDKLTVKEKSDYDLFIAYSLNTLYWLYLRTKGRDPNSNDIKNQLNRVKEYMLKAKQANERNTIRPAIDKAAASRFIKHGIHYKENTNKEPPNKKIRFDD